MSEYSVICIIPARGGSKGLSRKNLRELDGATLGERPIKHALESGVIDTVLVTTDDSKIAETALKAGAEVPFMRPKDLSEDLSTTEETIQHALLTYESLTSRKYEIGVFLTATDVFLQPNWIGEAVAKLKSNSVLERTLSKTINGVELTAINSRSYHSTANYTRWNCPPTIFSTRSKSC